MTTGTFTVTRTGDTTDALNVTVAITGTATNGTDYTTINTTVTIPAGQASTTVTVTPVDDALEEGSETVTLTITDEAEYNVGANDDATVTIADDDLAAPVVTIEATDAVAAEAGGNDGTFTITRTGATTSPLDVTVAITGTALNGTDYTTISTTVTIPAGQASTTVNVSPIQDLLPEGVETVILTLQEDDEYDVGANDDATVSIVDDEIPLPTVTIVASDSTATEQGPTTGTFTVTRTGITVTPLDVTVIITGTATNGTDYTTISTTVTIPAGQSSATVTVTPIDDALLEGSETVILSLADDSDYVVGVADEATVTITDNEEAPSVTVEATDPNASESGPNTGTFTITRTGATTDALNVTFTLTGTATNGTDYGNTALNVTIPAGQASTTVTITPIDDQAEENSETAVLTLTDGLAYDVGVPASATVTIADNDATLRPNLTVTIDANDKLENPLVPGDKATIKGTITNSGTADVSGVVYVGVYLLPGGQATPGDDDVPLGEVAVNPSNLQQGETAKWSIAITVSNTLAGGSYHLVAVADSHEAVRETNEADNTATLANTDLVLGAGNIPGRTKAVKSVIVNGITYTFSGPGSILVTPGINGAPDSVLVTTDDSLKATLTVKGVKGENSVINDITVNGSVKSITLTDVTLDGNVTVSGLLTTLKAGVINLDGQNSITISGDDPSAKQAFTLTATKVQDLDITSSIPIKSIGVNDWDDTNGTRDDIVAPSVGSINSKADLDVDITSLSAAVAKGIDKVTVTGVLESVMRSISSIGTVTAGRILNSKIFAGVDAGLNTLPVDADDFIAGNNSSIGTVTAKGIKGSGKASFINSMIAARSINSISVDDFKPDNGGEAFGAAATSLGIKSFKRNGGPTLKDLVTPGAAFVDGDFVLRIVA